MITVSFVLSTDYSTGFGGKYGVQKDRVDKAAVGWDHQEHLEKHESQKGIIIINIKKLNLDFSNCLLIQNKFGTY